MQRRYFQKLADEGTVKLVIRLGEICKLNTTIEFESWFNTIMIQKSATQTLTEISILE